MVASFRCVSHPVPAGREQFMTEKPKTSPQWIERIRELHQFLQGNLPEGVKVRRPPRLTADQAWTVIWFVQEGMRAIPDHFERCSMCGDIFDSYSEGIYIDD